MKKNMKSFSLYQEDSQTEKENRIKWNEPVIHRLFSPENGC